MRIKRMALLSVACVLFNPAFAGDTEVSLKDVQALIQQASNGSIVVESVFEGPNELTGAVMRSPTGKGIAWIPSDGKNIMVGLLMDERGKNLSLAAHQQYIGEFEQQGVANQNSNINNHEGLINIIDGLTSITLGSSDAKKILYVFGDVNCHYCEDLYRLLSATDLSEFTIKWIPVAVLGKKSLDQAATLLSMTHDEQVDLLSKHHGPTHKDIELMSHNHGRFASLKNSIDKSGTVLASLGTGTPLLAYWNGVSVDIIPKSPTKEELATALEKIKPLK